MQTDDIDIDALIAEGSHLKNLAEAGSFQAQINETNALIAQRDRRKSELLSERVTLLAKKAEDEARQTKLVTVLPYLSGDRKTQTDIAMEAFKKLFKSMQNREAEISLELEHIEGETKALKDIVGGMRKKLSAFDVTAAQLAEIEAATTGEDIPEAECIDDALDLRAHRIGIDKKTRGQNWAIFGGVPGRASSQGLIACVSKVFKIKRWEWYAGGEHAGLASALKRGTYHAVMYFKGHAPHAPDVMDAARIHRVKLLMLPKFGKQSVFDNICAAYGVKTDAN